MVVVVDACLMRDYMTIYAVPSLPAPVFMSTHMLHGFVERKTLIACGVFSSRW